MRQYASVPVVVALLVAAVAGPAAAVVVPADAVPQVTTTSDASDADVKPGHKFSGVVGVQQAELEGEIEERRFGARVNNASNETKADVVASEVNQLRTRLQELRAERERLREARENGSISEGTYRSRIAINLAKVRTTNRMLSASEAVSTTLPPEALEAKGVNVAEIRKLRHDADELSGPEVAAIAQSVVGDGVGKNVEDDDERGPDDLPTRAGGQNGEPGPKETPGKSNGADNETAANETATEGDSPGKSNGGSGETAEQRRKTNSSGQESSRSGDAQSDQRPNERGNTNGENTANDGNTANGQSDEHGQGDERRNDGQGAETTPSPP